jgi:hypothetical protein
VTPVHAPNVAVPTLTEVVEMEFMAELQALQALGSGAGFPPARAPSPPGPALELVSAPNEGSADAGTGVEAGSQAQAQALEPGAAEPLLSQDELTSRILQAVQQQVDAVLEQRMKDALVPILANCAEAMMHALRQDLSATLHDVVAGAVATELRRHTRG